MRVWILLAACASKTPEPLHDQTAAGPRIAIAYRTYGLMPPPQCGSPTYAIDVAVDGAVACGWTSSCPPYSEAKPLRPAPHGRLAAADAQRLVDLARAPEFRALDKFDSNPHIIDGGLEHLDVTIDGATKTVELANLQKPAFTAFRQALESATGCSLAAAGPEPP